MSTVNLPAACSAKTRSTWSAPLPTDVMTSMSKRRLNSSYTLPIDLEAPAPRM